MRYLDLTDQVINGLYYVHPASKTEIGHQIGYRINSTMHGCKWNKHGVHQYWHCYCTRCGVDCIVRSDRRKTKRCKCKRG